MGLIRNFIPKVPHIPDEIRDLAKDEKWTISQERVFIEDLVYKRMTAFLALVAAALAGATNLRNDVALMLVLMVGGTALCWVCQQTIHVNGALAA